MICSYPKQAFRTQYIVTHQET